MVTREAENTWELEPGSYDIQHASGKVDSVPALQQALRAANGGVCKLEVIERPEGKIMRKMHSEMKLMEGRLMQKLEESLVELRKEVKQNDSRLSSAVAPLVQCIAVEQIELRSTLQRLTNEAESSTATPLVCSVTPVVSDPAETGLTMDASVLKDLDELERELQQECAAEAEDYLSISGDNFEAMKEDVAGLAEDICPQLLQPTPAIAKKTSEPKHSYDGPDLRLQWPAQPFAGIPYSTKMKGTPWEGQGPQGPQTGSPNWSYLQLGGEDPMLFAHDGALPHLRSKKQGFGWRSCPVLPPLQ